METSKLGSTSSCTQREQGSTDLLAQRASVVHLHRPQKGPMIHGQLQDLQSPALQAHRAAWSLRSGEAT